MTLVKGACLGTLVFLDVDELKQVIDTQGHLTGDRMLADLGARLRQIGPEGPPFPGISVSWGVSTAGPHSVSLTKMVQEADAGMYRHKSSHHSA